MGSEDIPTQSHSCHSETTVYGESPSSFPTFCPLDAWSSILKLSLPHLSLNHGKMADCREGHPSAAGLQGQYKRVPICTFRGKTVSINVHKQRIIMELLRRNFYTEIHKGQCPLRRRCAIHFSCCHDVCTHDKWFCTMKYGYQTTLLRNSHLYLLLIKFMYVDMTLYLPNAARLWGIVQFLKWKNTLVSKLRTRLGITAGKGCKWHWKWA